MDKTRKSYIVLSIILTLAFIVLGASIFYKSYLRFFETIKDLGSSCKFYFFEIFGIEHSTVVTVIEKSKVLARQ